MKPIIDKVTRKAMITWKKKKKSSITVIDGYFHFTVNLKTLKCSCPFKQIGPCPCIHVTRVLLDYLKPEDIALLYIPYVMEQTINDNLIEMDELEKTIKKHYATLECQICMGCFSDDTERRYRNLTQCSTCFNIFHTSCDKKWKKSGKGCSSCLT